MRRVLGDLVVTAVLVAAATLDGPDVWRLVARGAQRTAEVIGRVGLYAEGRAAVLTSESA